MTLEAGTTTTEGMTVELIEDLIPLHDVTVSANLPKRVKRAVLQPQNEELQLAEDGEHVLCTIREFSCHQMLVLEY